MLTFALISSILSANNIDCRAPNNPTSPGFRRAVAQRSKVRGDRMATHIPEVVGSNPAPATEKAWISSKIQAFLFASWAFLALITCGSQVRNSLI